MNFAQPLMLGLLLVLPLLFLRRRSSPSPAHHPLVGLMRPQLSARTLAYRALPVLGVLGLAALIVALAGPRLPQTELEPPRSGLAIMMTIDRSGSMGTSVETPEGETTRLEIVKKVFANFARERRNDLIGLIDFARYPETLAPLSGAGDTLQGFLDTLALPQSREEDGTSIGDAVALATARLKAAGPEIKSRVLILLTDGLSNAGSISPIDAAKAAADAGVRLYAIGFDAGGFQVAPDGTKFPLGESFDSQTLTQMATMTGGQFFVADSADSLKAVYGRIDSLEKSKVQVPSQQRWDELYGIFALIALVCLGLERSLALSWLRRMEA